MRYVLVHSPFTGPAVWRAAVEAFGRRGLQAQAVRLSPRAAPSYAGLAAITVEQGGAEPAVLVVHSGAGGLAPAIVAAGGAAFRAVVFVDAVMPHPGRSWFDTAGDALGAKLRAEASDGEVKRWDRWFPDGALASLVPEADRDAFVAELAPTPLAYLDEPAPTKEIPQDIACTYLRLSKVYEDEAAKARRLGWPTLRLDADHLAMMTRPDEVVSSVIELTKRLR